MAVLLLGSSICSADKSLSKTSGMFSKTLTAIVFLPFYVKRDKTREKSRKMTWLGVLEMSTFKGAKYTSKIC